MYLYSSRRGQALVELAILLPFFVVLFLAIFAIGRYWDLQISLDMAVAEALRADSLGYNAKNVFYQEWQNLTGKNKDDVEFRISRNFNITTIVASSEIKLPEMFSRFNLVNPKVHSKLSLMNSITRK